MSEQNIEKIHLKDLVLWSENPRQSIDPSATDQDIVDRAINKDQRNKWSIKKLFKSMGDWYDSSEIPTVVYMNNKPVVYDGNRRIIIGKIIHNIVEVKHEIDFQDFDFPLEIQCNVCDKKTALKNVYRKHVDSGSWDPLERDIFLHKHMGKNKTDFLIIDEETGLISSNPEMNQRFVRDEIFQQETLKQLSFSTDGLILKTKHSKEHARKILVEIVELVRKKEITTRKNRHKILELLKATPELNHIIQTPAKSRFNKYKQRIDKVKLTPRIEGKTHNLFGKTLPLQEGTVNNLYRDICDTFKEYKKRKETNNAFSQDFPMIIRMSLRLICEVAAQSKKWDNYIKNNFIKARNQLSKDEKTTLSNQGITKNKAIELLQTGAHGYTSSNNMEQTVALSLVIGRILEITYGKDSNEK